MFLPEEDIEAATDIAIKILGPQGRMIPSMKGKSASLNITVNTKSHGNIWYGDLYNDKDEESKLIQLAKELNDEVWLLPMN